MNAYTPMQTLTKVHRELYSIIRLLRKFEVDYVGKSKSWGDVVEIDKVLTAMVEELGKIIMREKGWEEKSLNLRQAQEFALKAQVAKASQEVADVVKKRPWLQSHK